jgi:hypothetical protein
MSEHIIVLADRVKELSRTTGSGNIVLDGAATGFGSFANSYTYNDALFYAVTDGINYEVGSGQYILDGTDDALTRFPFNSSNGNAAVNFQAGVKEVYVTYPGKYAVMSASGLSGFDEPDASGLAFWGSNQLLNYDSNIIWDKTNSRLGINNTAPTYAIDIGGEGTDSSIRVSGLIVGTSGVTFSNGVQLTAYTENALDATTGTDAVFALSGVSNQIIQFQEQNAGLFFAGPPSGCNPSGACAPDMPTFRVITDDDLPSLASTYLTQDPAAYDSGGMGSGIAFWSQSGVVDHDPYLVWDKAQNFLGVNKLVPTKELDVDGDAIVSGAMTVGGDLAVFGSLDVQGSLTYIDSLTVTIADHQIELGSMSGVAVSGDAYINDGGIVIKSQDSDKKWTWIDATDAWTSSQSVDVPSVIFDDSSVISGAYHSGSGISISNGIEINVADVFAVAGNDAVTTNMMQADGLYVSGVSGVSVSLTSSGVFKTLIIDPSVLIGNLNASGTDNSAGILANSASGLVISGIADANSTNIATNVTNISINVASGITNALGVAANVADIAINSASGAAISGWANTNFTAQDGRLTVNEAGILANSASGDAVSIRVTTAEAGILANSASGTAISGWASTNFAAQDGRLTVNEAGILANSASGVALDGRITVNEASILANSASGTAISGWASANSTAQDGRLTFNEAGIVANSASGVAISGFADYTIDASGALLDTLIDAVSGWSQSYTDGISFAAGNGWNISDQLGNTEVITNNNLTISGVSGLNTFYDSVDDNLIVSGGTLETSIAVNAAAIIAETASGVAISGWSTTNFASQDGRLTVNEASILANAASGVAISGWSTTNFSSQDGRLTVNEADILANAASVTATNVRVTTAEAGILANSASGVAISGWAATTNVNADAVLDTKINANSASGVAISGWADANNVGADAVLDTKIDEVSGWAAAGGTNLTAGTGLFVNGGSYHTSGVGYFSNIRSYGISDPVSLGPSANDEATNGVFVGRLAGNGCDGDMSETISIGYNANQGSQETSGGTFIGPAAGIQISGVDGGVGVGDQALGFSDECYRSIGIGYFAGKNMLNSTGVVAIGESASQYAKGSDRSIAMGIRAMWNTNDCYASLGIGINALLSSSGCNYITAIGEDAFRGSQTSNYSIAVGHGAFAYSTGVNNSVAVGQNAAESSYSANGYNNFIGWQAGLRSTGNGYSNAIGYSAGKSADLNQSNVMGSQAGSAYSASFIIPTLSGSVAIGYRAAAVGVSDNSLNRNVNTYINDSVVIGYEAGLNTDTLTNAILFGKRAGSYDWNHSFMNTNNYTITDSVIMGEDAGSKHDDLWTVDYNVHRQIGHCFIAGDSAAFDIAGNITRSTMIGPGAGSMSDGTDNIYMGEKAGSGISGNNNIILGSGTETGSVDNVINLNDTIISYSTDHRYTRIGYTKDLSDTATLSIMPAQTDQNVLNLLHGVSAPTVDMMVAQTGTAPFAAGRNAIINKNGFLRVPSFASVATATAVVSATTNEGVLLFAGDSILVSDGSVWYSGAMVNVP